MAKEITLGRLSQVPAGEGRTFQLSGLQVAVFHTRAGGVFATQAHCPHRGGPLADGLTDDISVVCPLHDRIYNLRTGAGIGTGCNITVYPVRVTPDGEIQLLPHPSEAMTTAD